MKSIENDTRDMIFLSVVVVKLWWFIYFTVASAKLRICVEGRNHILGKIRTNHWHKCRATNLMGWLISLSFYQAEIGLRKIYLGSVQLFILRGFSRVFFALCTSSLHFLFSTKLGAKIMLANELTHTHTITPTTDPHRCFMLQTTQERRSWSNSRLSSFDTRI